MKILKWNITRLCLCLSFICLMSVLVQTSNSEMEHNSSYWVSRLLSYFKSRTYRSRTATGRLSALDYIDNRSTKIKPGLASAFGTVTPRYLCILSQMSHHCPSKWHGIFTSQNSCRHRLCMPEQLTSAKKRKKKENALLKICCVRRSLPWPSEITIAVL